MPYDGIWPRRHTKLKRAVPVGVYASVEAFLCDHFPPEQRYTNEWYTLEGHGSRMLFVAQLGRNKISGGQLIISLRATQREYGSPVITYDPPVWSLQIDPYPGPETPEQQVSKEFGLGEAVAEIEIIQRGIEKILLETGLV